MKTIVTVLACLLLLCVGITWIGVDELYSENRVLQTTINALRERNKAEKDSLTLTLTATRDSLQIAFATIKQANAERLEAHERTQKTIRDLRKIIFIQHTDSSRTATLKQLYKTYTP